MTKIVSTTFYIKDRDEALRLVEKSKELCPGGYDYGILRDKVANKDNGPWHLHASVVNDDAEDQQIVSSLIEFCSKECPKTMVQTFPPANLTKSLINW